MLVGDTLKFNLIVNALLIGGFVTLLATGIIPFNSFDQECIDSHIGIHKKLNPNNKVTFPEEQEICDVYKVTVKSTGEPKERLAGYKYTYEFREANGKSFYIVLPSCDGERFNRELNWNSEAKGFICPDGAIAREYNRIGDPIMDSTEHTVSVITDKENK